MIGQGVEVHRDDFADGFTTQAVEVDNPMVRERCFYLARTGGFAGTTEYAGPFQWDSGEPAAQVAVNPMPDRAPRPGVNPVPDKFSSEE
jgi:hypothetical protein